MVTVNYNTRHLLARLLFGLRCVLNPGVVVATVVVDNASTDGSRALLGHLEDAGLVEVIRNDGQRYHGPGLTQGVNLLAQRQATGSVDLDLVWVLDTDVLIVRADTLDAASAALVNTGAALAGEPDDGDETGPGISDTRVAVSSLLFDPRVVWQAGTRPFLEDGDPARHLQYDLAAQGRRILSFPFRSGGYLVHLGRSTLAEVVRAGERSNRYYAWATDHHTPHFGHAQGAALAATFETVYQAAMADDSDRTIVEVLRSSTV